MIFFGVNRILKNFRSDKIKATYLKKERRKKNERGEKNPFMSDFIKNINNVLLTI